MNKKAQEMSMSIVIIAALAVIVLLLVGSFMTGGFKALTGKVTSFSSGTANVEKTTMTMQCDKTCDTWKTANCDAGFSDVRSACAGTIGSTQAWSANYIDSRDGATYQSTCEAQVGTAAVVNPCVAGVSGGIFGVHVTPTLSQSGNYVDYTIRGAGGTCSCRREYAKTSGWGK